MSLPARYECPDCLGQIMDGMPLRYRNSSFACKCNSSEPEGPVTIILGQEYQGKPRMGSPAFDIFWTEQRMGFAAAERQLRAKNAIRRVWGMKPLDLQDNMDGFGRKA